MHNTLVTQRRLHGFSILEMSIVVLIIGLLVGGLLGGQHLVNAAEIRAVGSDKEKYISAVSSFVTKYNYLPGDFPEAVKYWGAKPGCDPDAESLGTGTQTCNGDGDKQLGDGGAYLNELYLAWQHMRNADLIDGAFTGSNGPGGNIASLVTLPGVNIPAGRIDNTGYSFYYNLDAHVAALNLYPGLYGITLFFGKPTTDSITFTSAVSVKDTHSLDNKLDDGMPATGTIRAPKPDYTHRKLISTGPDVFEAPCTIEAVIPAQPTYNINAPAECTILFLTGQK